MMDRQLDLFASRDEAIQRAVDHAEAVEPGWANRATELLLEYLAHTRQPFTTLELRHWALGTHGFAGVTNWAWGSVMAKARKAGIIEQVGTREVGDATSHLKVSPLWRGCSSVVS
jgi:hypothetical protein